MTVLGGAHSRRLHPDVFIHQCQRPMVVEQNDVMIHLLPEDRVQNTNDLHRLPFAREKKAVVVTKIYRRQRIVEKIAPERINMLEIVNEKRRIYQTLETRPLIRKSSKKPVSRETTGIRREIIVIREKLSGMPENIVETTERVGKLSERSNGRRNQLPCRVAFLRNVSSMLRLRLVPRVRVVTRHRRPLASTGRSLPLLGRRRRRQSPRNTIAVVANTSSPFRSRRPSIASPNTSRKSSRPPRPPPCNEFLGTSRILRLLRPSTETKVNSAPIRTNTTPLSVTHVDVEPRTSAPKGL